MMVLVAVWNPIWNAEVDKFDGSILVQGTRHRVQGTGYRVQGSGFRVQGLRTPRVSAGFPRFPPVAQG